MLIHRIIFTGALTAAAVSAPAHADCGSATPVDLNTEVVTTLGAGQSHYYRIAAPGNGLLSLYTENTTDTYGTLLDPQGIQLEADSNDGAETNFLISRRVSAGDYCLQVKGENSSVTGTYRLVVQGDFASDDYGESCASGVEMPALPTERFEVSGELSMYGDRDWFLIDVPASSGRVTIQTEGEVDTYAQLLDSDGVQLEVDSSDGSGANAQISRILEEGRYCVGIYGESAAVEGPYQFVIDLAVDGDDHGVQTDFATASVVYKSTSADANLAGALQVWGDTDMFQIEVPAEGGTLTVYTEGQVDTYGRLYDQDGVLLQEDSYDGAGNNFSLSAALQQGLYWVSVSGEDIRVLGDYQLVVSGAFANPDAVCDGKTVTIHGTIGNDFIEGTGASDVISTFEGDDVVHGLAGNDTVCGGPGIDVLIGGDGSDRLLGDAGDDVLRGDKGGDKVNGGDGTDICDGGSGTDTQNKCETRVGIE